MTTIRSNPTCSPSTRFPAPPQQVDAAQAQAQQDRFELTQATQTLLANFKQTSGSFFGGGTIDMNDLYAAAQGQRGPQVQQAAQYVLSHPAVVQALDGRKNGKLDGKISQNDLKLALNDAVQQSQTDALRYDPRLNDFQTAVGTLASYLPAVDTAAHPFFSSPDGKISRDDLNKVITGNYPPQLRQAAFFLTMNPDLTSMLDTGNKGGTPDGTISRTDLNAVLSRLMSLRSTMPAID